MTKDHRFPSTDRISIVDLSHLTSFLSELKVNIEIFLLSNGEKPENLFKQFNIDRHSPTVPATTHIMKSSLTNKFRKELNQLPEAIQKQVVKAYEIWQSDPYQGSLQFKRVSQKQPIYSARVGLNYRVLGLLENDHIYWFWIGSHAEYDEILKRL